MAGSGSGARPVEKLAERLAPLRDRVAAQPYDIDAWEALVAEVHGLKTTPEILPEQRAVYEALLAKFPTASSYWKQYAELEMAADNQAAVKAVFSRCLLNCLHADLWRLYLRFIKKVNEAKGPEGLPEVRKAYEYTLDRVGQDINAGPLWQEYVAFLQNPRPGSAAYQALFGGAVSGQEDAQRTAMLRRAFQRALLVPTHALDQLWRSYEAFEKGGANKTLAQRVVTEYRPRYQQARQVLRDRTRALDPLNPNALPLPPGTGGAGQAAQVAAWGAYLAWERGNPQRLEPPLLATRVALAYDQALMPLLHYPDVWYEYSRWHSEGGGGGMAAAQAVLKRGRKALPGATMLALAAADLWEAAGDLPAAQEVYESLVAPLEAAQEAEPNGPSLIEAEGEQVGLAWMQYQRFARRTGGVQPSRKVFMRYRKATRCSTWQVNAMSAISEWRKDKNDKVARNIFEFGLKEFIGKPGFVLCYVDFLLGMGDIDNTRALFERALPATEPGAALPLWDRYLQFEYEEGDMKAAMAVQKRRQDALESLPEGVAAPAPAIDALQVLMAKHHVLGLWPATPAQAAHLERLLAGGGAATPPEPEPAALPSLDSEDHRREPWPHSPAASPAQAGRSPGRMSRRPAPSRHAAPLEAAPAVEVGGDIKQMPAELGRFINDLPPPQAVEGPVPEVELVVSVLMAADLSPAGVAAAEAALAAGRPHPQQQIVSLIQPAPVPAPLPLQVVQQQPVMQGPPAAAPAQQPVYYPPGGVYNAPPAGGPGPMISVAQQQLQQQGQQDPTQALGPPATEQQHWAGQQQGKRKLPEEFLTDQQQPPPENSGSAPPGNDVYRMRQKQRSMADG